MKKIKNGFYTTINGNEYRIARDNGLFYLMSEDPNDINNSFTKLDNPYDNRTLFEKKIDISEIGEVYRISTYAIYHGHDISIESSTDDTILLTTSDKMFYEKYGFEETERFVYRKIVSFDEVELAEERRPARYIESAKTFV